MTRRKNPEADLKAKYKQVFEVALIVSLLLNIAAFQASKRFSFGERDVSAEIKPLEMEDIPKTEQFQRPPPPARPAVPIESESEDLPEDETIEITELDLDEIPPPPPPPEDDASAGVFVAYDDPPAPIGGFAAIQKNLKYPEIARKAGVEGRVYVNVLIDKNGDVVGTKILKSLGNNGCDEAAVEAIRKVKWKPAKQRDKPVKVWVGIPVVFKLK